MTAVRRRRESLCSRGPRVVGRGCKSTQPSCETSPNRRRKSTLTSANFYNPSSPPFIYLNLPIFQSFQPIALLVLSAPARDVRLLSDHRDYLVAERTRAINRLRWHLHELDPGHEPPARALWRPKHLQAITAQLAGFDGIVARLARVLVEDCRRLNDQIQCPRSGAQDNRPTACTGLVRHLRLRHLTAAKIIGETADVRRFRSRLAFARHNGTAPLPVWSSNKPRHRLSRTGNRQLNAAIHRIAITQAHYHANDRALLDRRREGARTRPSRCASSSAGYPMSSIEPCYQTPNPQPTPLLSPRN